jgi:hypothetical protein
MTGKILVVVFALLAGAAGAYGYELVSHRLNLFPREEDPRVLELEGRLAAMTAKVEELGNREEAVSPETDILSARLSSLEEKLSGLRNGQEPQKAAAISQANRTNGAVPAGEESSTGAPDEQTPGRRISGEELLVALQELPDEGKVLIRQAIRKEVQRMKQENELANDPRKEMEKKVSDAIQKATVALSLTPVQVEQAREIGLAHIDKMLEAARLAKESGDPEYAKQLKKQVELETEQQILQILTPEQIDRMREMDPDGFGSRHPRGF